MPSDLGDTIGDEYVHQLPDTDPTETQEWMDSLDAVASEKGSVRARFLLAKLLERAHETRLGIPGAITTPYVNTIPLEEQPEFPGDEEIERRIRRFIRWNAAVMVV
jgi:pyruvate dehydrogenase E1 component